MELNEFIEHDRLVGRRLASGRRFGRAARPAGGEGEEKDQAYNEAHVLF
jgi:hypothetical protein